MKSFSVACLHSRHFSSPAIMLPLKMIHNLTWVVARSVKILQTVTIRGSYLQKIPFGTLSEVIAPWLQGTMNSKSHLVFVVDGNLVNDVNAWSIYDIEEITLVQNAMVQVNGAINQQQLVLVKTKRNAGETGFTIGCGMLILICRCKKWKRPGN